MNCVICKNEVLKEISSNVRDSNRHRIVECSRCGFLQIDPIPTLEEDIAFYNQNLQETNVEEPQELEVIKKKSEPDTKRRIELVLNYYSPKSSILDIGSGYGFFVNMAREKGFEAIGAEISKYKSNLSHVLNLDPGKSEKIGEFDLITMFHVLEHISNPVVFLRNITRNLKKGGDILIEVPNRRDLLLSASKEYRDFYWQRAHLLYFDELSLIQVMKEAGFEIKNVLYSQRYGIGNMINWLNAGKPQLVSPEFSGNTQYAWLEDCYREYLCKNKMSDTLTIIGQL